MAEALRFQTRARTVDHLGREQIADCPTAISELWKNAYDAYARSSSLHIFDGEPVVASIYDDGHGMSRTDFIDRWLVIGTEAKLVGAKTSLEDRHGLAYRRRQGKKGIGRLSVAFLGNLLLVLTKKQEADFVAALIDWRIFENPFLILDDIRVPLITLKNQGDLFEELPGLYDTLLSNVWGDPKDKQQTERVTQAWAAFDSVEGTKSTTRTRIEETLIGEAFKERHLEEWNVWKRESAHGTALVMSGVIPDLRAQLSPTSKSPTDQAAIDTFRDTLWSFVDPFTELSERGKGVKITDFSTSVTGWRGDARLPIIETLSGFESNSAANLEHTIDGHVDESGCFRGRVKAFGEWLPDEVEIKPITEVSMRSDSKVGPFDIYVGSMEVERRNSSHTDEEHRHLVDMLDRYSGLMVFRDGFRVMPYGRPDSDYFGVEERRSKSAGREFWNHRRMLGRIAISNEANSNLKDKAGREGIIDNQASKIFKRLVIDILMTSARRYFGSDSDIRKRELPKLQQFYSEKRKEEERERLLEQKRRKFRTLLQQNEPMISQSLQRMTKLEDLLGDESALTDEDRVSELRNELVDIKEQRLSMRLGAPPARLAPRHKELHARFKVQMAELEGRIHSAEGKLNEALDLLNPKSPKELAEKEMERHFRYVQRRLWGWCKQVDELLDGEKNRLNDFARNRSANLKQQLQAYLEEIEKKNLELRRGLSLIEEKIYEFDAENETQLAPIISALESLSESINLDLIANSNSEDLDSLRTEVMRLNALAQLGITVEIIDHELSGFSGAIAHGLGELPAEIKNSRAVRQITGGFEGLSSRLRFLSPLRLSGEPNYSVISGKEIEDYIREFFQNDLATRDFEINSTPEFRGFSVREQKARLFPVFVNLVNNARYWLHQKENPKREIMLSIRDGKVIVSDNGPGIDPQDLSDLFRLFFTKRQGGRGVGLYLCRANLAAGGHKISYATEPPLTVLPGANFVIDFKDASFE